MKVNNQSERNRYNKNVDIKFSVHDDTFLE